MSIRLCTKKGVATLWLLSILIAAGGCTKDYLDPTQIGRFRPTPVVNVILDSLGIVDEAPSGYANAEDPTPEDLLPSKKDYTFGTGDVIRISIYELQSPGIPYVNLFTVTESGHISIPDVGLVQARNMTESELENSIKDLLSPDLIKNPSVTVLLEQSQNLVFSISGEGIRRPDQFAIPRYDEFRLSRAIAMAGGTAQFNVSNIYVTRQVTGKNISAPVTSPVSTVYSKPQYAAPMVQKAPPQYAAPKVEKAPKNIPSGPSREEEMLELIEPYSKNNDDLIIKAAEMSDSDSSGKARIEWVFEDGKYVPVRVAAKEAAAGSESPKITSASPKQSPPLATAQPEFGWDQIGSGGIQSRVIKIPTKGLMSGDPKYDIIIRPGDSIKVPVDVTGEFTITGNVNFRGFVSLQGRPMTLKMAIAAAGGLSEEAWPSRVEVIRRIGENKEVIVMVDLEKIAKGLQPDFFIKPNDLINVGSHPAARYLATLRGAFRATYGFGFIYDRNFATRNFDNKPFDDITWPF